MRRRWRFACVVLVAVQVASVAGAQRVVTESGAISGLRENGLEVYKGIPFAAPPVGDLRWRPPVHAAPWTGTRKADAFAPACMQVGVSMPGGRTHRAKAIRRCLARTDCGRKVDTTTNVARVSIDGALGDAEWTATQTEHFADSTALEC